MRIIDPFATQGGQAVNIVDPFESQPPAANGVAGLNIIDPFEQNATQPSPVAAQAEPEPAGPVVAQETPAAPPVQEAPVTEQVPPAAPAQPTAQPVAEQVPPAQTAPPTAPVAEQVPPALGEPTPEELAAASKPAFIYRSPGKRAAPVTDPNAINMPGSVMDKQVAPTSEFERTSKAPIRPEVRAAFNAQWDAATPQQREILAQQPGLTGQLAREREELFAKQAEALGGVPTDSTLRKVDPRVEERRARLIAEGEDPEFADIISRLSVERGVPPGQEIAAIGTVQPSEFDFETNRFFREQVGANNPLVRGTAKAVLGLGKSVIGINEFLADSIGADKYAKFLKEGNKWVREKEGAVGEKGDFLERNLEGAISSIGQQLPWMIGAAATGGGTAIPLIAMGLQSFGQEYSDGRSRKQDVQQAATRASIFAAFEVLGEKFGLKEQLKALRGAAKGMDNSQIVSLLASALKKEVPGELFTTTGQFAADKWMPQGYALNPNATVEDFVKQVADTIAQTVLQAGVMGAGTTGVSTARRFMGERGYGEEIAAADAETARTAALQKAANMFKPATPRAKTAEQPVTEQQPEETSEFNEYGYVDLPEYKDLQEKRNAAGEQFTALASKADSLPEGSDERNEATIAANKFFADFYEPLQAQIEAIEQSYDSQASTPVTQTAPTTETARVEPTFTVDPETGEVTPAPAAPVEAEALIEREAQRYAKTYNLPLDLATDVIRGQYARGELDVESLSGEQPGAEAVAGRIEPSISVPSEGATTPEGVASLDTDRLDGVVGTAGEPVVGAGAQRTALDESLIPTLTERAPTPDESLIPTLTERAPAPTYAQLPAEDKAPVLQEAQQMWQAGEANLPMAKAWNSLPSWKRDMFAAQVYENYDEITTNPEAFRAAMDKVIEAKKPADAEVKTPAVTQEKIKEPADSLDKALISYRDDPDVGALLLADEIAGESHIRGEMRAIASVYLTQGKDAGRKKLLTEVTDPESGFGLMGLDAAQAQDYINEVNKFLSEKTDIFKPATTPAATTPVEQAQANLADAEAAVAAATTPEAKKEAAAQRNVARQEAKKAEAAAPVEEKETVPTMQEMQDAGFTSYEIENLKKDYWPERYRQIKQGYKYIAGEFRQVTQADVDTVKESNKQRQVLKAEAKEKMDKAFAEDPNAGVSNIVGSDWGMGANANQTTEQYQKSAYAALDRKYGFADSNVAILESRLAAANKANGVKETPTAPKRGRPAKPKVEGEQKTPKPRGRRKIELTPEEQARKDAERGINQAEAIKAGRDVDKLVKFLSSEFDPANTKSPDFTKVATQGLDSVRREYIYKLHEFATNNAYRTKPASGGKARDFLANSDKITQKERADLQARLNFEKTRPPKPSAARKKTKEKADPAYFKFTTATQAIDHIVRNGTPFERILAARLKPFLSDVRLTVADTQENTPNATKELLSDASGVYSSRRFGDKVYRMIVLRGENFDDPDMQGMNNTIFLHEALHGATEAKIDEYLELVSADMPVPAPLQAAMNDLMGTMIAAQDQYKKLKDSGQPISPNLRHKFDKLDVTNDLKEFVAYGLTDPDVQQFLLQAPGVARKDQALGYLKNLFSGFVNSLRKAFNMDAKHQSALQDLMLATEGILREQEIEPAQSVNTVLNAKISKSDIAREKSQLSKNSEKTAEYIQEAIQTRSFDVYKDALKAGWSALSNSVKRRTLYATPTPNIIDWKGDQIPAFKDIDRAQQYMSGMRQNLLRAYAKQAEALSTFLRTTGVEGKDTLTTAMDLARLENVTPSVFADRVDALQKDPRIVQFNKEAANPTININERAAIDQKLNERRAAINNVFDAWEALGKFKDGHKIYKMVRQSYKDSGALTRALLDRNIDRLGLEGDVNDPSTPKGRLMLSVRRMYEDSEFKGVVEYFPFMRHGLFVLEVQGPLGRERYHFDKESKRTEYKRKRAKEINADPEDGSVFKVYRDLENENRDRFAAESRMLTDMFNAVETATEANTLDKEALKDELYQIYLTTLPEQSFRKQYMHADNVIGFSSDVMRNFKTYANRMANQAAKLRYAPEIVDAIQRAKDTLIGMPPAQQSELGIFVDEMARRGMEEINPAPESKLANLAAQASFYMLLTGAGSAAIQTTALPVYVMPVLNANYGYGAAAASFAKWTTLYKSLGFTTENVDGVKQLIAPTVAESSLVRNSPLLQRAFNEATARDLIGQSLSSNIIDLRRTPENVIDSVSTNSTRVFLNTTAGLFSGSERLTREISFMMAFELEYAKSGDFDKSVDAAADVVQRYVGRFDRFARAPIMRGWGKVPLQFKNYAGLVTTFLIRNAAQVITGNGAGRMAALNILGGILLLGTLFYGLTGLPLYGTITAAIDAALESLEDEEGYLHKAGKLALGDEFAKRMIENKRRRIEKDQFTATNSDMRFRYEFLPKWTGGITFGGEDGKRYSLATMLERGPISVTSDVNVGPRMSLDGLWFKQVRQSEDFKEKLGNWVEALASPPVTGAIEKIVDGTNDIIEGKPLKGGSQLLPPAYGNILKSELVRQEGVKTRKDDMVISKDELSVGNIIAQATGLGSTRAAALQDKNFKTRNEILIAQQRKNKVLEEFRKLVVDPKNDGSPEYLKKWDAFFKKYDQYNARYPMERTAITPESLNKVAEKELEARENAARGLRVREQLRDYILPRHYDYIRQVMGK